MKIFNNYKLNKKAAIEVQFNWIFVLIAGTVILLFIISLIFSQKKSADAQLNYEVIKKLQSSLTAKLQSSDSYNEIELMQTTLKFTCDKDTNYADFKIEGADSQPLPIQLIFSPKTLSGTKVQTWTLDFNLGFPVSKFLMMTTPDTIFVFYGNLDNTNINNLFNEFPSNITKKRVYDDGGINGNISGFKTPIIICISGNCPSNTYTYINISPELNYPLDSSGNITFHKSNKDKSANYLTKTSMYAAIFSNDRDYYECMMERALKQFEIKRALTYKRIELIIDSSALPENCVPIYTSPMMALNYMENKTLKNSTLLYQQSRSLDLGNNDLIFGGCPLIY